MPWLTYDNTIILDGADSPPLFPYSGYFWRRPYYWFIPRAHKRFRYFKREWIPAQTYHYRFYRLLPEALCKMLPHPKNLRKISFSIPEEKIIKVLPRKTKLFPRHIVDPEVARKLPGSSTSYAFNTEEEYYADLQSARFGITTKRSGWDCLRHYEIAANGTVICFRELDKKPVECAPHGLEDGVNCLTYKDYEHLMQKINYLSPANYELLQQEGWDWAKQNSCQKRAEYLMNEVFA